VDCDVGHIRAADLATVNALARAHLNARRRGTRLRFTNVSPALRELVAFAGLEEVLLGRDGRQSEEREQPLGVEERVEADDPPA
jgi:hypothetical protein